MSPASGHPQRWPRDQHGSDLASAAEVAAPAPAPPGTAPQAPGEARVTPLETATLPPGPPAFRVAPAVEGVRVLVFDAPGQDTNLLTRAALRELRARLATLAAEPGLRGLLLVSGKPGHFSAGSDVAEMREVHEAGEGQRRAAEGQRAVDALEDFPAPTCAAIEGSCVSGGFELALACRYRLASDAASTSFALPEVRLGIVPALGGTVRLPRLVGLRAALRILLAGRAFDAGRARELGVVDDVLPSEDFRDRALWVFARWIDRETEAAASPAGVFVGRKGARPPAPWRVSGRRRPSWAERWLVDRNPVARAVLLRLAARHVDSGSLARSLAASRLLQVLDRTAGRPREEALALEAETAGDLLVTEECRNLTAMFCLMEQARRVAAGPRPRAVGVLGLGTAGSGFAGFAAASGLPVRVRDLHYEAIAAGLRSTRALLQREAEQRRRPGTEIEAAMARLSTTVALTGFRRVDVLYEALPEDVDRKRRALAEIEPVLAEGAVVATGSAAIPLEQIESALSRPERLVGFHLLHPPRRMALVEVSVGPHTSEAAREAALALAHRLGKIPVVVRSGPGYLVNRILHAYFDEALRLFQAGVPIEPLDRALAEFGMPLGPLATLDEAGLDTMLSVERVLRVELPSPDPAPSVLGPMIERGRLGRKSGCGFYRYDRDDRARPRPDPAVYTLVARPEAALVQAGPQAWCERLILAMVNEAARALGESVVSDPCQLDLAMLLGAGFPRSRGGLLRHADVYGLGKMVDRLQRLAESCGPRFSPAPLLSEMAGSRGRFRSDFPR